MDNSIPENLEPLAVDRAPKATIGRIVILRLSGQQADEINRRRTTNTSIAQRIDAGSWPLGAQAHIGNEVKEGQEFPMIVVAVWGDNLVNGQVLLDGCDSYWATSIACGSGLHAWRWPERV